MEAHLICCYSLNEWKGFGSLITRGAEIHALSASDKAYDINQQVASHEHTWRNRFEESARMEMKEDRWFRN